MADSAAGAATARGPDDGATRVPRSASLGPALIVLTAVGIAYANAFAASFQFDDWDVIVRDPRVQSLSAWWQSMPGIRPLLKLSYALHHASGLGVVGFHAVNVAIHATNALLVLTLVRALAARGTAEPGSGARADGIALATALVFALHPVQTEAVTYASGRSTSLSTGLALASLWLWVRARDRGGSQLGSIALMLLALGVKESALGVPAAIALWVASEPGRRERVRAAWRAARAHALVLLVAVGASLALPAYRALAATSFATRSPLENLVAQVDAIVYLAGQLVRFDRLNADPALEAVTRLDPMRAIAAGTIAAIGLAALAGLARRPLAAFAVAWTFVWLAPTNSLVARLDLVNDRQLYAALVGPALLLALAIDALARRVRRPRWRAAVRLLLVAAIALGLGLATHRRNEVYRDELVFWQDVTRKSPRNARAFNNLGFARAERCELDAAATAWRRALALDPTLVRAAVNLRLLEEGAGQAERCRGTTGNPTRPAPPVSLGPRSPRP
ncbi:MAG: tetratricopeptide repeat protein [Myxococcota bacterium]